MNVQKSKREKKKSEWSMVWFKEKEAAKDNEVCKKLNGMSEE